MLFLLMWPQYQIGHCDLYMQKCTCFGYYLPTKSEPPRNKDADFLDIFDQLIMEAQHESEIESSLENTSTESVLFPTDST